MPRRLDLVPSGETVLIWLLAAFLWILRLTSKPGYRYSGLFALYSASALVVFRHLTPSVLAAIGCTVLVCFVERLMFGTDLKEAR